VLCRYEGEADTGARPDSAEGGQINDTGSQKSIPDRGSSRGASKGEDDALCPISGLPNTDRRIARRAISPRLGAFRGPLIAAITVIIDLLRGPSHQAAISSPRDPRARVAGISLAAEAASGRRLRRHGARRAVQWVIQSVGRVAKRPPAAAKLWRSRCESARRARYLYAVSSECR